MTGQSYFQLISPLIFLVFSCGFAVLWHYSRDIAALRFFVASYFLGACALIGDFLRNEMDPLVALYTINTLYMATAVSFCAGLFAFYRGHVPWRSLLAQSAIVMLFLNWFRFGHDEIVIRTLVMNAGAFVMFTYTAFSLRREMSRLIDRVLQVIVVLNGFQLLMRTLVVLWYEHSTLTEANYAGSIAALSLHFSVSIAALASAAILFVMFGMEIVANLTATSQTDPMTGTLNRRGLEARVAVLTGNGAGGHGHAVVLADIDRFKKINDRHGHEAGDRIISHFARTLSCLAREDDFVVRWGGEEFIVVMPGADVAMARLFAESARAAFEALHHECIGGEAVTASFGIAAWSGARPIADAAHLADRALYRAKRGGRNRVCVQSASPDALASQSAVA